MTADHAALVRQAVAGDRSAFAALIAPQLSDLARLCRRVGGSGIADDSLQDTVFLALLRLPALRDPNAFVPWLRGIAIRVCRRNRARVAPHAPATVDEELGMWLPGPGLVPSLDDALAQAELAASVRAAVADLPAGQRQAIQLFYLQGLSYEESAAVLGIPIGALKTRLHKARAALAHHFRLVDTPRPLRLDDRTLSVHEAAHAVLGWQVGDLVIRIAIIPHAEVNLGIVQSQPPPGGIPPAARLVMLMAGEAGVDRTLPHHPRSDSGDRAAAARVARAATGGDDVESALLIADALNRARERLAVPRTWSLVERVAAAVAERRVIDADEFRTLVAA